MIDRSRSSITETVGRVFAAPSAYGFTEELGGLTRYCDSDIMSVSDPVDRGSMQQWQIRRVTRDPLNPNTITDRSFVFTGLGLVGISGSITVPFGDEGLVVVIPYTPVSAQTANLDFMYALAHLEHVPA